MTKPLFQMWTLKPSGRTLQQEKDEFGKGAAVESCTGHLSWEGSRITPCHGYKKPLLCVTNTWFYQQQSVL